MEKPTILIVDDEKKNIKLLEAMLTPANYHLYGASNGRQALERVAEIHPDLVLLDVMMPEMDGFEVCRRLKQDESTRMIPVLMVTALREKDYGVQSMQAGADDFLSKPVDMTELIVRVKSMLRIKSYHDELRSRYQEIAEKNQRLEELEQVKAGLTAMIIHDMNNPLMGISGNLQMLLMDMKDVGNEETRTLQVCLDFCMSMKSMIQGLLDIDRLEAGKLEPVKLLTDITEPIREVLEMFAAKSIRKSVSLRFPVPADLPRIVVDRQLIQRVVANLVDNAIRHTPPGGDVCVTAAHQPENARLRVSVKDTGNGLAPEFHTRVFNRFEQVDLKQAGVKVGSSGLGLNFCKLAVEAHGGRIWVESDGPSTGSVFQFTLPLTLPAENGRR